MSDPESTEDTGRLAPVQRHPAVKRRVTVGLAVTLAVVALVLGAVIGYVARGGPPDRVLVTTDQPVEVVTVTTQLPSP